MMQLKQNVKTLDLATPISGQAILAIGGEDFDLDFFAPPPPPSIAAARVAVAQLAEQDDGLGGLQMERRVDLRGAKSEPLVLAMHRNPNLTHLNLAHTQVMTTGALSLSLLGFNHSVTSLNLKGCRLGVNGGVVLAEKLLSHSGGCALTYLNLKGNDLRGTGGAAVARALSNHPNVLMDLNLSHNRIDLPGFEALGGLLGSGERFCGLTSLNIKGNNAHAGGAEALAFGLRTNHTLIHLDLQGCGIVTEGAIQVLEAVAYHSSQVRPTY